MELVSVCGLVYQSLLILISWKPLEETLPKPIRSLKVKAKISNFWKRVLRVKNVALISEF
jgi:hypothetical protein